MRTYEVIGIFTYEKDAETTSQRNTPKQFNHKKNTK